MALSQRERDAVTARTRVAYTLISGLRVGDPVVVTMDGTDHVMFVSRGPRRSDGAFGSWESTRVTVSYGPGRYSREVAADSVGAGYVGIARATVPPPVVMHVEIDDDYEGEARRDAWAERCEAFGE